MAKSNPIQYDYLAFVSEWTSTSRGGGQVGNAYPVMNLTTGEIVTDPADEFPNPGAVFLTSRANLKTWDFVVLQPEENSRYNNSSPRDCYYITARLPTPLTQPSQSENVAVILDHAAFDFTSPTRQLQNPRHNVTPIFFVQKNQVILGPLLRDLTQLSSIDDVQRIDWRPAREDGIIYEFTREELAEKGIRLALFD